MAVAFATLPLGAAAGEVDACLAGGTTGLAGCFAVGDLAATDLAAGLTMYGTAATFDLVLFVAGLATTTGLVGAPTLTDPPLEATFGDPALLAVPGLEGATFPLLIAAALSGLTGDFAATFLDAGFGDALAALFARATFAADLVDGLDVTLFGAAFRGASFFNGAFFVAVFGATFTGAACLPAEPFLTAPFLTTGLAATVLASAVFLLAAGAAGFLAATDFPEGFLAAPTAFFAALLLPAAGLLAAFNGTTTLPAVGFLTTGLLATGLAAELEAAVLLARVAAATTFLPGLPAAFPFCAFTAVEPCVVFAISLHRCGRGGRVL